MTIFGSSVSFVFVEIVTMGPKVLGEPMSSWEIGVEKGYISQVRRVFVARENFFSFFDRSKGFSFLGAPKLF